MKPLISGTRGGDDKSSREQTGYTSKLNTIQYNNKPVHPFFVVARNGPQPIQFGIEILYLILELFS